MTNRIGKEKRLKLGFGRVATLTLALSVSSTQFLNARESDVRQFSFVVLGHVRGDDNGKVSPLLGELLAEVRKLSPDLIFLTGDMIWGDVHNLTPDPNVIKRDWDQLDAALEQLGVPVYRVPGNHDINDPVTRDIYFTRYGELPRAFSYRGSRFILLNSSWVPEGSGLPPLKRPDVRGRQLGSKQIKFIQQELSDNRQYDHVFLFMHHLLWWHKEEAAWWRDVHPLLVGRNVRAVFGGDYGPMKFSHMRRDGIDYIQSSIEGIPSIEILRILISSRLLSQQFDNYLYVTVNGPRVINQVKTVGEISMGNFSPQRWRAVNEYEPPMKPIIIRIWEVIGSPRRLAALVSLVLFCFFSGFIVALIWKRYKKV
ncbi:MAG: metallophosphoesterase [Deltaproteobacteria bacterium]|nr:metallophosphoesterase [Deltaproteobacteria bacterium]